MPTQVQMNPGGQTCRKSGLGCSVEFLTLTAAAGAMGLAALVFSRKDP